MKRFLCILMLLPVVLLGQSSSVQSETTAPRIHEPGFADFAVSIYRLYLTEDYEPIRAELRKLEAGCRELKIEAGEVYGSEALDFDRSFHRALDRTRELASGGEWDDSEKQYDWVLRSCVGCHRVTREAGLGPPAPLP